MHVDTFVIQDSTIGRVSRILRVIGEFASATLLTQMRASVAYASLSGCKELHQTLTESNQRWVQARKRWLIGIDFGQTSPDALRFLSKLKNSEVRIPNGMEVLGNNLQPRVTFHPKTFVMENIGAKQPYQATIICGSANLTFGGLRSNAEHIYATRCWKLDEKVDSSVIEALKDFGTWWERIWGASTPLNKAFLDKYEALYGETEKLQDVEHTTQVFVKEVPLEVAVDDGLGWAAARCFWIETNELYKNRGEGQPGNQLDCRRGTRVYFSFSPAAVPQNTVLGQVRIQYEDNEPQGRSIRFANNSMDKVNLPIPIEFGPSSYDNSILHFERIAPARFRLTMGNAKLLAQWRDESAKQNMHYSLAGGRQYGFYS